MSEELVWNYSRCLHAEKGYSRNYLCYHRTAVRHFLRWLAANRIVLGQADSHAVQEYLRLCRNRYGSIRQVWGVLQVLRSFARFAIERGLITKDPTTGLSCAWLDSPGGFGTYEGALRKFFSRPGDMVKYRLPLFAPYWEGYLKELAERGYAKLTLQGFLPPLLYFHRYLVHQRIRSLFRVRPETLRAFLRDRAAEFKRHQGYGWNKDYQRHVRRQVNNFLIYAFEKGGKCFHRPHRIRESRTLPRALLSQFLDFCRTHKGVKETTIATWSHHVLEFRSFLEGRHVRGIEKVTVADVDAFLLSLTKRMKPVSINCYIAALRPLFKYLYLHEQFPFDMARCIQSPCRFHGNQYPKYLPWQKIQAVLAGVERNTALGKRDYALLSLLSCHGLRPSEVARLHLTDINWDDSSLTIRERKNGSSVCLPLAAEARDAIKDYLPTRPVSSFPNLFLNHRAPFRPFQSATLRWVAVKYQRKSLDGSLPRCGAYLFRHSFAKAMIDRGATLPQVGAILGHKRLDSTFVYTRIDTGGLREAADNYADLL